MNTTHRYMRAFSPGWGAAVLAFALVVLATSATPASAAELKLIEEETSTASYTDFAFILQRVGRPRAFRVEVETSQSVVLEEGSGVSLDCDRGLDEKDRFISFGGQSTPIAINPVPPLKDASSCLVDIAVDWIDEVENPEEITTTIRLYAEQDPKPRKPDRDRGSGGQSGLDPGGKVIGRGRASGEFAVADAGGDISKPRSMGIKAVARPYQQVDLSYSITCSKRGRTETKSRSNRQGSPAVEFSIMPFRNADYCTVGASAQLDERGSLDLKIYGKR